MYKFYGFTIVEVIVVITIIALISAITLVSYGGIQARTRSANAQTLAESISSKAKGWYSANGVYPTFTQLSTGKVNPSDTTLTGPPEARISDTSTIQDGATTDPANEKIVGYRKCTSGAQVEWYNAIDKSIKYIGMGGATSTGPCS